MAELKPCPFCGGEAYIREHTRIAKPRRYTYFRVGCEECGLRFPKFSETIAEAIEAWNRRIPQTEVNQYGENCTHITNCGTLNLKL